LTGSGTEEVLRVFEELYAAHGTRLKSIACNLLGSRADAEDAVQEAFLKAFRSWDRFKGDAAPFTWLYRILVNACLDQGRRRQRRREEPEPDMEHETRSAAATDHPLRLALEGALRQLSPRPRAVFVLAEVEGFTHREIGDLLGIAEGTSKHDLFQARNELRQLLRPTAATVLGEAAS
jgi:RNA polymerase sigma-70 factor (ECF subfamily)